MFWLGLDKMMYVNKILWFSPGSFTTFSILAEGMYAYYFDLSSIYPHNFLKKTFSRSSKKVSIRLWQVKVLCRFRQILQKVWSSSKATKNLWIGYAVRMVRREAYTQIRFQCLSTNGCIHSAYHKDIQLLQREMNTKRNQLSVQINKTWAALSIFSFFSYYSVVPFDFLGWMFNLLFII